MSQLDAGHFDNQTCYAAINRIRLDDLRPHIWRTHDGGKTWKEITRGLPDNEPINTVREDPKQKGLLYAGSENAVYVSFDDGENWQSLRLNMPATSIRDLVVKDDDLVVGTHGRSFWILDNITPLRQQAAGRKSEKGVLLYQPQTAYRVRWNMNTDTPLPQEEPAGQNPPDGAMIDYVLEEDVENIYLTIEDAKGQILVYYTPEDLVPDVSGINFPLYWIRPKQVISGKKGAHRLVWDLHLVPLPNAFPEFPISATFNQTAQELSSPWVMPGFYNVVLHVNDNRFDQTIDVRMAPRVQTDLKDLKVQYDLALKCYEMRYFALGIMEYVVQKRKAIPLAYPSPTGTTADSINDLSKGLDALYQLAQSLNQNSKTLHDLVQESDFPPTHTMLASLMPIQEEYDQLRQQQSQWLKSNVAMAIRLENIISGQKEALRFFPDRPVKNKDRNPQAVLPEWRPLFQPDLSNAIFPKGIWSVTENGELTATEDQCIFTQKTYKNFVLDLEFKTAEGTNSGVIIHCSDTQNWIPNSVEVQIADDHSAEWSKADPTWQCAAIFGHLAADKKAVKHPGEWNRYTIYCMDHHIWVVLNGELVNHMDMSRWLSGTHNPDGSAIPSWLSKPFATLPLDGHIGFQGKHAGAPIWFRNIRIRELW